MRIAVWLAGASIITALTACGGDPLEAEVIVDPYSGSTGLDAISPAATYPSGPYGVAIGDVMQDATFFGFRNAEAAEAGDAVSIALSDFYDPDGEKGIDLLFISIGAVWCQPCQIEKRMFPEIIASLRRDDAPVAFFQNLYEGGTPGTPSTLRDLERWQVGSRNGTGRLDFPVVIDPKAKMSAYFDSNSIPYSFIVDAKTMTIVATEAGFDQRKMPLKDKDGNVVCEDDNHVASDEDCVPRMIFPLERFIRKHLP